MSAPAWSPDGSQIAFLTASAPVGGSDLIGTVNLDGTHLRFLRLPHYIHPATLCECDSLDWSPDGKRFLFIADEGRTFVVDLDGGGLRRLPVRMAFARWSPDGKTILYEAWNIFGIRTIGTRGGQSTTLPWLHDYGEVSWASDGRRVAVSGDTCCGLHIADLRTRSDRRVPVGVCRHIQECVGVTWQPVRRH